MRVGGEWGMTNGSGSTFWGDKNVLKLDSGDGYTTLNTQKKLNCTLKNSEFYDV